MKNEFELCPFSKPILGRWCQCEHAKLADRCSGKMSCTRFADLKDSCQKLDEAFKSNTRFILGVKDKDAHLTHAHLMKIRCGGILGMRRVLNINTKGTVNVRDVINEIVDKYEDVELFPYNEIVQDIKNFKHRK